MPYIIISVYRAETSKQYKHVANDLLILFPFLAMRRFVAVLRMLVPLFVSWPLAVVFVIAMSGGFEPLFRSWSLAHIVIMPGRFVFTMWMRSVRSFFLIRFALVSILLLIRISRSFIYLKIKYKWLLFHSKSVIIQLL